MPLSPSDRDGEPDLRRQAIGFWMFVGGTRPAKPVRVFVTYEALARLSQSRGGDSPPVFETFKNQRAKLEAVASNKFDSQGADEGDYGGRPILMIGSQDLASAQPKQFGQTKPPDETQLEGKPTSAVSSHDQGPMSVVEQKDTHDQRAPRSETSSTTVRHGYWGYWIWPKS